MADDAITARPIQLVGVDESVEARDGIVLGDVCAQGSHARHVALRSKSRTWNSRPAPAQRPRS